MPLVESFNLSLTGTANVESFKLLMRSLQKLRHISCHFINCIESGDLLEIIANHCPNLISFDLSHIGAFEVKKNVLNTFFLLSNSKTKFSKNIFPVLVQLKRKKNVFPPKKKIINSSPYTLQMKFFC